PVPWLGQGPADVVRAALGDSFPSVEIPDSMLAALGTPQGAAADVDFALSTLSIPGITAAVGPGSSRATILVAPLYAQRGIPLISATATSLGDLSSTGWVFQLVPSDSVEGDFLVRYAADLLGARRLAVFYLFHDEYGV